LHGPEPAKRWLQQHLVAPWKRAGASTSSTGTISIGSSSGPCMAAGFCSRALLLHGPSGSGKTEVVHALASEMGANLLYLPGGESLLKTYQQEGHRLLRALFAVSRNEMQIVRQGEGSVADSW
jgi:SpoVK/Ycf46/Vps4 family AAA+-type ATPase